MKVAKTTVELSTATQNKAEVRKGFHALCKISKSYHAQIFYFYRSRFFQFTGFLCTFLIVSIEYCMRLISVSENMIPFNGSIIIPPFFDSCI